MKIRHFVSASLATLLLSGCGLLVDSDSKDVEQKARKVVSLPKPLPAGWSYGASTDVLGMHCVVLGHTSGLLCAFSSEDLRKREAKALLDKNIIKFAMTDMDIGERTVGGCKMLYASGKGHVRAADKESAPKLLGIIAFPERDRFILVDAGTLKPAATLKPVDELLDAITGFPEETK